MTAHKCLMNLAAKNIMTELTSLLASDIQHLHSTCMLVTNSIQLVKMSIITTDTDAWSDLKWSTTTFRDRCFFVLSQTWDKEKLLHSHEVSNCRPWDSALQCSLLSHRTSLVSYSSYRPFQVEWIQVVWIQYIDRINIVQRLEFTITFFTSLFCILCFALQVPMLKSTWILW